MQTYESTTTRLRSEEYGSCALIQDLLPLYLEGEVSPGSRELITEHLARCERCAGFLAGAQSVRTQLRRDSLARQASVAAAAPEGRSVQGMGRLLGGIAVIFLCLIGAPPAALVGNGLFHAEIPSLVGGLIASLVIFGLLAWLGRVYGPISQARLLLLLGGCALGGLGMIMVTAPFGGGGAVLPGLAIGLVGIAAVWTAVLHNGQARRG